MGKNLPAVQGPCAWFPGWEDPLGEGMVTHSSILAWRIPWICTSDNFSPFSQVINTKAILYLFSRSQSLILMIIEEVLEKWYVWDINILPNYIFLCFNNRSTNKANTIMMWKRYPPSQLESASFLSHTLVKWNMLLMPSASPWISFHGQLWPPHPHLQSNY